MTIITQATVKQQLIYGFYTGKSFLGELSADKVNKILAKRKLTLYAPFEVKGIPNVPIQWEFCNLSEGPAARCNQQQQEANAEEAKKIRRRLAENISLPERKALNKRLWNWKEHNWSLYGRDFDPDECW